MIFRKKKSKGQIHETPTPSDSIRMEAVYQVAGERACRDWEEETSERKEAMKKTKRHIAYWLKSEYWKSYGFKFSLSIPPMCTSRRVANAIWGRSRVARIEIHEPISPKSLARGHTGKRKGKS